MLESGSWGHSVLQTPALVSTSFFAKYLRVGEDGPGREHLCHTDTFLVDSVSKQRTQQIPNFGIDGRCISEQNYITKF